MPIVYSRDEDYEHVLRKVPTRHFYLVPGRAGSLVRQIASLPLQGSAFAGAESPAFRLFLAALGVVKFGGVFGVVIKRGGGEQGKLVRLHQAVAVVRGGEDGRVADFAFVGTQGESAHFHGGCRAIKGNADRIADGFGAGHGVGDFLAVIGGFDVATGGVFDCADVAARCSIKRDFHRLAVAFHGEDVAFARLTARLRAQLTFAAAALHDDEGGVAAADPGDTRFVVVGVEQGEAVIKGGHQAVGAADAAACEVAGGEIFHHRGGITSGGGARLRVGAGIVRVAAVVFLVAVRVLAEIGGVILRRLGQLGIGAQFLYSCLRPPVVEALQPRFRFFIGVIMPL